MAKYQFAEQARKTLEENGVVINDMVRQDSQNSLNNLL